MPFKQPVTEIPVTKKIFSNKFPFVFFGAVLAAAVAVIVINIFIFEIRPGNSYIECTNGCKDSKYPKAAAAFCNCIYNEAQPLDSCLKEYEKVKEREQKDTLVTAINR
ncbi:hypothetical protein [Ferruginibacter sp.]